MPLLGPAAMLLSFDVVPEAITEHDDWHTHEHLPERRSIPGFLRGSRWGATRGQPRYLVVYEVAGLGTLTSAAYLERLNHPSAWTSKMMPHYRGMRRGLCSVVASHGLGVGHLAYLVRFEPRAEARESLQRWLLQEVLPALPAQRGVGSAHCLQGAATAPMTNEQRIRGADAGVDAALLVWGTRPRRWRNWRAPFSARRISNAAAPGSRRRPVQARLPAGPCRSRDLVQHPLNSFT